MANANATGTVQLNVTGNAVQQLQRVQKQVDTLGKSFAGLKNILGGIAFGAFINNTLRSADAMDDLAKATGLSIATIDGLGTALQQSGGDANDVATILGRFSQSLEELKDGSLKSEFTLNKLGLSFEELRTLSDEDALRTIIQSLAKMPAGAERTALAMQLLGKSAKGIDWNNLNGSLDQFIEKAKKAEPGTKALAQLYDNLQGIGKSFTQQLTIGGQNVAETLVKLTNNVDQVAKALVDAIQVITSFGFALALLNLPKKATELGDFIDEIRKGKGALGTASQGVNNLKTALQQLLALFKIGNTATKNWEISLSLLGFSFVNLLKFIGRFGGIISLFVAINFAVKKLTGDVDILGTAFKLLRDYVVVVLAALKLAFEGLGTVIAKIFAPLQPLFERAADILQTVFSIAIDVVKTKLKDLADFYKETVAMAEEYLFGAKKPEQPTGPAVAVETGIGAAKEMAPDFFKTGRQKKEYDQLKNSIEATTAAFLKQRNAELQVIALQSQSLVMTQKDIEINQTRQSIYDQFTDQIIEYKNKLNELKPEQEKLRPLYLAEIATLEQLRKTYMDLGEAAIIATNQQLEAQQNKLAEIQNLFAGLQVDLQLEEMQEQLTLIGLTGDELEKQTTLLEANKEMRQQLLDLAKQMSDIEMRKDQMSEDAYNREKTRIQNEILDTYRLRDAKIQAKQDEINAIKKLEQDAAAGSAKAAEDSAKAYTPYQRALDSTRSVIQNLEDGVAQFVKTGKLNFKDLTKAIIADLIRIQLQAALNPIFSAVGKGIGTFVTSLLGFAEGGNPPVNKPSIVGEKGPELFVPKTAGTIIPNDQLGKGKGMATGAVSAPVTNNYITNNISAIDAKSVAQLFAENRKAIFGANKMAEREMSYVGAR